MDSTVPLTFPQKARLAAVCLPFPFFVAALAFYYAYWVDFANALTTQRIDLTSRRSLLFTAFMGFVILQTGLNALRGLRDLSSGVALITEDRLIRSWRSRRYRRAAFERLGKLRVVHWSGSPGEPHRVVYSPATKIAWEAVAQR